MRALPAEVKMPQVIVLAAIGTVAYVGYKYLKRAMGAGLADRKVPIRVKSVYLERGPDGVFRPVDRVPSDRI
jgi:hypothetical protein